MHEPDPQFYQGNDLMMVIAVCLGLALAAAISLTALVMGRGWI